MATNGKSSPIFPSCTRLSTRSSTVKYRPYCHWSRKLASLGFRSFLASLHPRLQRRFPPMKTLCQGNIFIWWCWLRQDHAHGPFYSTIPPHLAKKGFISTNLCSICTNGRTSLRRNTTLIWTWFPSWHRKLSDGAERRVSSHERGRRNAFAWAFTDLSSAALWSGSICYIQQSTWRPLFERNSKGFVHSVYPADKTTNGGDLFELSNRLQKIPRPMSLVYYYPKPGVKYMSKAN